MIVERINRRICALKASRILKRSVGANRDTCYVVITINNEPIYICHSAAPAVAPASTLSTPTISHASGVIDHQIILQINPSRVNYYGALAFIFDAGATRAKPAYFEIALNERGNAARRSVLDFRATLINGCVSVNNRALPCVAFIANRMGRGRKGEQTDEWAKYAKKMHLVNNN